MRIRRYSVSVLAFAMTLCGISAQRLGGNVTELKEWQFSKDGASWEQVTIPHSYNAIDGHSASYYRGKATYKRTTDVSRQDLERPMFLLFEGAAQQATVSVNGREAVHHMGGYTPFVINLKSFVREGKNDINVVCDNHEDVELIPVSSDFNKNGGLHNPAFLLKMNPVYLSPETFGLYRLHVSTPEVSREKASARVETKVVNSSGKKQKLQVKAILRDKTGHAVAEQGQSLVLPAGTERTVALQLNLDRPHLWDGLDDPYLYTVDAVVLNSKGKEQDKASTKVGFRFYEMTRDNGFFLNGRSYPLRGVAEHQDMDGKASALTHEDFDRDYKIIQDLGCNFLRLAHYPHNDYEFRLCDSLGLIVQTEIPWVNCLGKNATKRYFDVIHRQMTEMIQNLYNHPSIVFWGMWNELDTWGNTDQLQGRIDTLRVRDESNRLYKYAKGLDPYRYVGLTDCSRFRMKPYEQIRCDFYSENRYNGWYTQVGNMGQFTKDMTDIHNRMGVVNVAEYGAGVDPWCHSASADEKYLRKDDQRHFEEYGSMIHESHARQILAMPFLNFTSVWILFDFPVANRQEGFYDSSDGVNFTANEARKYTNDKGLVTRDRKTKKDSYYLYRALWNKKSPTVYITSRRMVSRKKDEPFYVKVYSSSKDVTLYQNGEKVATQHESGESSGVVYTFGPLKMKTVKDTFRAVVPDGTSDEVSWNAF